MTLNETNQISNLKVGRKLSLEVFPGTNIESDDIFLPKLLIFFTMEVEKNEIGGR